MHMDEGSACGSETMSNTLFGGTNSHQQKDFDVKKRSKLFYVERSPLWRYFVIVSDISSGRIYGMYIYIYSFWHSSLAFFQTFYFDILFWHSIWHLFWRPIWHPFWHLFWHFLWHSFWNLYLAYLLTVFLAFYLLYLWILCGWGPAGNTLIREHCYLALAVEVRRGSLWSWGCCSGPAGNTAI